MRVHSRDELLTMTPSKALEFLKEGNQRFLNNLSINRNLLQIVNDTAEGQYPFAVILSCSDSRISNELIFDQGLGDVFSVRLAGNIASINAIGSMEYACKVLGSKMIVVMSHTNCGAVTAACNGVKLDNLTPLLEQIQLAIQTSGLPVDQRDCNNKEFINDLALHNVYYNIDAIMNTSDIIRNYVEEGTVGIAGTMYNVSTGQVEFYNVKFKKKESNDYVSAYKG